MTQQSAKADRTVSVITSFLVHKDIYFKTILLLFTVLNSKEIRKITGVWQQNIAKPIINIRDNSTDSKA